MKSAKVTAPEMPEFQLIKSVDNLLDFLQGEY